MKKRVWKLLLVLALLACLSVCVFAESQLWHITDDAGVLTAEQNTQLEDYAQSVSARYGVGVYIVTIPDHSVYSDSVFDTAWSIYHDYTLGEGDDRDGAILLISVEPREFATFFYGPQAEYAFDKHGQASLEDYFVDDLRADDWAGAMQHFISGCEDYLERAAQGHPVRRNPTGTLLLIAGCSMFFALMICLILKRKMKSVRAGTQANAYVSGDLALTASHDQYTHTTETRTKIEKNSDSGSSSHAESGGGGSGRSGSF